MRAARITGSPDVPLVSKMLHRISLFSASSSAALLAAAASCGFLVVALVARSASRWLTAYEALAAAVTLVMVFVLQHTQTRQQMAVQRKLDEILRVLPEADSRLVRLESASQEELDSVAGTHETVRRSAIDEESPAATV